MKDVYISREELDVPCPSPEYDVVFEKLITKWWLPLKAHAYKIAKKYEVARELHIDTMAKLWENRYKIDRLYNFFNWAKTMMARLYIDELRKYWYHQRNIYTDYKTRDLAYSTDGSQEGETSGMSTYGLIGADSDKGNGSKFVQNAIFVTQITSVLTDDERNILKAIYDEELTADEAAEKLKITTPALKSKLYRSLRKMKQVSGAAGYV
jgi:RNA polymerase sigma factor (sigma-70 family)